MSLINEALRKARKEAAERDAEERGVSYRPPRAHLPAERSWLPALAGVALGAVLAAAAFFFLLPRSAPDEAPTETPKPVQAMPSSEMPSSETPSSEPSADPQDREATEAPEAGAPAAGTPETPPPLLSEPKPVAETPTEGVEPATLEEPPPSPTPAPPPTPPQTPQSTPQSRNDEVRRVEPAEQTGRVDEAVYVLEATVDGVALRLDFIVWSASPFAQINGRQVSVGQAVEGFRVREISREEVVLEGADGRFTLRVR